MSAPGITAAQATGISWGAFDDALRAIADEFAIRQVATWLPDAGADDMVIQVRLVRREGRKR